MTFETPDDKTREALSTVGQYLSDTIPPVQAAEAVGTLMAYSAQLIVTEIVNWIPAQLQGNAVSVSVADYLFHAVSKLHYLAHLQLISEKSLAPYLDSVKQQILERCPPGDRELLQENFSRLGISEPTLAAPAGFIHRQPGSGENGSEISGSSRHRRLSLLQNRLRIEVERGAARAGEEDREDVVPHLLATAASSIETDEEFRKLQENLRSLGMDPGTDKIFRKLSLSLPGWMIASTDAGDIKSHNAAIEAMSQIIHLAADRWESSQRFQDMVQAAIEQFNTGSLARAATMFDLALSLCSDARLDSAAAAGLRETAHESLDFNRLRNAAKDRDKHRLLKRVLFFFDEFAVKNLLDRLRQEEKRDRRRLYLDLLEAHGEAAREAALARLRELLGDTNVAMDWHFARNLVCILNRIPRPAGVSLKEETELVSPLLRLSLPAPLIKEAINFAGQTRCAESEDLLISTADMLVKSAAEKASSDKVSAQRISLLDRLIFALAHFGTAKANMRVVRHATDPLDGQEEPIARLAYFSGQDLTSDRESLSLLIKLLKSKMPRKLFGMTLQKNEKPLLHIIKALSSTPAPVVRETFRDIAAEFPETEFGRAAAGALKEFAASDRAAIPEERMLTGDLELFGLPDLLQQLNLMQATGVLTLKDSKGNPAGTFSLLAGRMQDCSTGNLEGLEAAYQLLELPAAGTFVFHGKRSSGTGGQSGEEANLPDLNSVLAEGVRRYDALQRARAIVPDFALLRSKGPDTAPPAVKEEAELCGPVWQKIANGASPEECEAVCRTDSYRVRTLLARWSENGFLTVE